MTRHLAGACAIVIAGAAWTQTVIAQDDVFRKGMAARDDQKWSDVVASMREAIRLNPQESTRRVGARLGLGGNEYLPHFHLGEALLRQDDCAGAMNAWDESERQGVVRRLSRQLGVLRKGLAECEAKGYLPAARLTTERDRVEAAIAAAAAAEQDVAAGPASNPEAATPEVRAGADRARGDLAGARKALESARQSRRGDEFARAHDLAESARRAYASTRVLLDRGVERSAVFARQADEVERTLAQAERTSQALAALLKSSPVPITPPRATGEARRKAGETLAAARAQLVAARKSRAEGDLQDARSLATAADAAYTRVHAEIDQLRARAVDAELGTLAAASPDAFNAIDARLAQVREVLASRPDAEEGDDTAELKRVEASVARARRSLPAAVKARDLAAARAASRVLTDAQAVLDRLLSLAPPSARGVVPPVLRDAAQAFLESRYQAVLTTLTDAVTSSLDTPARVHGHVLRAASLLALFEYSGRQDAALRARARAEVEAGKRLVPAFRPSAAAFSPRFIAFFHGSSEAGGTR